MSCSPTGIPSLSRPTGTLMAGNPTKFAVVMNFMIWLSCGKLLSPHLPKPLWIRGAEIPVVGVTMTSTFSKSRLKKTVARVRYF